MRLPYSTIVYAQSNNTNRVRIYTNLVNVDVEGFNATALAVVEGPHDRAMFKSEIKVEAGTHTDERALVVVYAGHYGELRKAAVQLLRTGEEDYVDGVSGETLERSE